MAYRVPMNPGKKGWWVMAQKKNNFEKGVKIICHGQYYYKDSLNKGIKEFSHEVLSPSLEMFRETNKKYIGTDDKGRSKFKENSFINVRGQLKRRLLPVLLGKKFPDFARVRFVVIDEIISLDGSELDLPITLRSKKQLAFQITKEGMPLNVNDYIDIDDLRADMLEYLHDPEAFLAGKSKRDKRRTEEREFLQMNNLQEGELPKKRDPAASSASAGIDGL
jgi:hypothetical protein